MGGGRDVGDAGVRGAATRRARSRTGRIQGLFAARRAVAARPCLITGEPGIGKTSLATTFAEDSDDRAPCCGDRAGRAAPRPPTGRGRSLARARAGPPREALDAVGPDRRRSPRLVPELAAGRHASRMAPRAEAARRRASRCSTRSRACSARPPASARSSSCSTTSTTPTRPRSRCSSSPRGRWPARPSCCWPRRASTRRRCATTSPRCSRASAPTRAIWRCAGSSATRSPRSCAGTAPVSDAAPLAAACTSARTATRSSSTACSRSSTPTSCRRRRAGAAHRRARRDPPAPGAAAPARDGDAGRRRGHRPRADDRHLWR